MNFYNKIITFAGYCIVNNQTIHREKKMVFYILNTHLSLVLSSCNFFKGYPDL